MFEIVRALQDENHPGKLHQRFSNLESSGGQHLGFNAAPNILPFIPITTGVFIASKSSIVRVLTRATSRTSWTRCLTHLPHATPSEHLEQIVVARNASIYGVRNRTKDTVWLQSLLKTLFWCVGACELKVLCHPHKLYVQHWTLFPVISQHECCLLNVALLRDYMLSSVRITREDVRALLLRYTS